ncbi:hypothetical protein CTI12_AA413610 [Artemisia annua]|uniref:Uncharacterized protein n=1 Tax=Artemisia annua TaxID=35608 RepID=A0A2U1M6D0_ARTAN|nr:hypothetical protein CTI12_AA413610 [Artemisia annua]
MSHTQLNQTLSIMSQEYTVNTPPADIFLLFQTEEGLVEVPNEEPVVEQEQNPFQLMRNRLWNKNKIRFN